MTADEHLGLFDAVDELPSDDAQRGYAALLGVEATKQQVAKHARILLRPDRLEDWSRTHHGGRVLGITEVLRDRPPLFVFAGDVGTGKTTLAETFGDELARDEGIPIVVMRMSLSARGRGAVGEMTTLIAAAFKAVEDAVPAGGTDSAVVLLIDEADALAQSRELAQMHHEDRAGVNALIRGVDRIAAERRPVITVLCSNRLSALDPAVRRRAAGVFNFRRPDREQRRALLATALDGADLSEAELDELAELTGGDHDRAYGFTYSDFTNIIFPSIVLAAYPEEPVRFEAMARVVRGLAPTPPFASEET